MIVPNQIIALSSLAAARPSEDKEDVRLGQLHRVFGFTLSKLKVT